MAYPVIGLTGRKRSGKDTFAARLVEAHGFTRLAFADALRDAALALDPIVEADTHTSYGYGYGGASYPYEEVICQRLSDVVEASGWERAKEMPEVRRTLQNFGVGIRALDPNFWLDVVAHKASNISGPIVVTDVRFPNEADMVERAGGTLVRIERPELVSDDTHESETALDGRATRFRVVNDGSVEQLARHADTIAALLH